MADPISAFLCAMLAVCEPAPAPDAPPEWAQTALVALPLIERWEGLPCDGQRCEAYLDTIAVPPLPTVCSGITRYRDGTPVRMGDFLTPAECRIEFEYLVENVYWTGFRNSLTEIGFGVLTVPIDAAFTSLTYNIGVGAVSRSTAVRRLNTGDVRGACEALTWWNRAGQRIMRGLVNRRGNEKEICLEGVT